MTRSVTRHVAFVLAASLSAFAVTSFVHASAFTPPSVWAVGSFVPQQDPDEGSHILTEAFIGVTWMRVPPQQPANTQSVLEGVAVASPSDVWAVGNVNI